MDGLTPKPSIASLNLDALHQFYHEWSYLEKRHCLASAHWRHLFS